MNKITLYEVYTNSDKLEGRGYEIVLGCYIDYEMAERAAYKKGVMGTNANIRNINSLYIDGCWFALKQIDGPSKQETKAKQALEKAKRLGMTEEEIERLSSI